MCSLFANGAGLNGRIAANIAKLPDLLRQLTPH
jgi:hypothetical protein